MHRAAFRRRALHGRIPSMTAMIPPAALRAATKPSRKQQEAERHFQRGLQLLQAMRWEDAARALEKAVKGNPRDAIIWLNLGQAQRKAGRLTKAIDAARHARKLDQGLTVATRLEASCLAEQHRYSEAASILGELSIGPADGPDLHVARGDALLKARRPQDAIAPLVDGIALRPDYVQAHALLGQALKEIGLQEEAAQAFGTAALLAPDNAGYAVAAVHSSMHACQWQDLAVLTAAVHEAIARRPEHPPFPWMMLGLTDSRASQLAAAQAYARASFEGIKPLATTARQSAAQSDRRIRVGYLSNDFHQHATAYLVAELLERHDRTRFEVGLYSYGPDDASAMRQRLKRAADRFIDVTLESDKEVADRIHRDEVDILIDLKGYTYQTRSSILAYRPAPIQVNFLGYPGTLGSGLADYIIGDPIVTPLEHAAGYGEKIAQMPHTYQPNDRQRQIATRPSRAECGLPAQGVVLCCFNNSYKITPEVFQVWCRLLAAVPRSILWLLEFNSQAVKNLRREAAARGVDPERLVFAKPLPLAEHLGRLQNADLFLDTLPVNAHTTASDALWAGVPVLTCAGESFAARVAASLCNAAGLPELVVNSLEEYEKLALEFCLAPKRLNDLRTRVREHTPQSPLFDTSRYAADLETLYERMVDRFRAGLAADHLTAAPAAVGSE